MRLLAIVMTVAFLAGYVSGAVAQSVNERTPQVKKVITQIDEAFRARPWPAKFALTGTYDEELIDRDFALIPSLQDPSELVRQHRNALHALTDEGFLGVLPFYLRTGLTSPKSEVMDHVVYYVNTANKNNALRARLTLLNDAQLEALRAAMTAFRDEHVRKEGFLFNEIGAALEAVRR